MWNTHTQKSGTVVVWFQVANTDPSLSNCFFFFVLLLSHRVRRSLRDSCQRKKVKKKRKILTGFFSKFLLYCTTLWWMSYFQVDAYPIFLISSYVLLSVWFLFSFLLSILWIYSTTFRIDYLVWQLSIYICELKCINYSKDDSLFLFNKI
jgi:apolipoprotein N-acyltransferase